MKNKQKAQKQNIKASAELIKYLQQCKLDNNHKSLEETIWSFIGYESNSKEEVSSNNLHTSSKPLPFQTQETPDQTRSDTQQVAGIKQPEGFLHTKEVKHGI